MRALLGALHPAFAARIPEPKAFSTTLLDASYSINKDKVKEIFQKAKYMNVIIDEPNNHQHDRVLNLSINLPKLGSYYIKSQRLKGESLTAEFSAL